MKPRKFFSALLMSVFSLSAFANNPELPSKTIAFSSIFTALVVEGDIAVVLIEGKSGQIRIEGDADAVGTRLVEGQLALYTKRSSSAKQTTVYVPSSSVSSVFVNAPIALASQSVLSNPVLKIFLGAEASVNVRSTGKVTVEADNDIRFVRQ